MITVNLKDLYYWCKEDVLVEITEEMLEAMKAADRQESAYKRRTYRYKAHYTLDMGDGIINECVVKPETPEEAYIREETTRELFSAIGKLTQVQQQRLIAYYFEDMNFRQIAAIEGMNHSSVIQSVKAALKKRSVGTGTRPAFSRPVGNGIAGARPFCQSGTRPQAAFPLGEPTGHFARSESVRVGHILLEVYDNACIQLLYLN